MKNGNEHIMSLKTGRKNRKKCVEDISLIEGLENWQNTDLEVANSTAYKSLPNIAD